MVVVNPWAVAMDLEGTAAGSKSAMVFGGCCIIKRGENTDSSDPRRDGF